MLARLYLRASTKEQDAERARAALERFAAERGLVVAAAYIEHASGARLDRPELSRAIEDSRAGDILIVEQIDRLSRLRESDWKALRSQIEAKGVKIVALDLPTSWAMTEKRGEDFQGRMLLAVNGMLLDMLAAIGAKDHEDRRRRQAEGIVRAKKRGAYRGRPEDVRRNETIGKLLRAGASWSEAMRTVDCSRATVAKVAARLRDSA